MAENDIGSKIALGASAVGSTSGSAIGSALSEIAPETYVVHGAKICCSCGSRPSRLVVQVSHGVFIHDMPQLNITDSIPIQNIQVFGICRNPNNPAVKAEAQKIVDNIKNRKKGFMDKVLDFFSKKPELEVNDDLIKKCAALCTPVINIKWIKGKEDMLIDGEPALLSKCKISCIYGGEIKIIDDGQRK